MNGQNLTLRALLKHQNTAIEDEVTFNPGMTKPQGSYIFEKKHIYLCLARV